jgi:hypothetical protein
MRAVSDAGPLRARLLLLMIGMLASTAALCLGASPAAAIMVKLPGGRYANYDAMSGAKTPRVARRFDAAFTNLDYSGGPVMPANVNYTVVWQPSNYGATPFQSDYVSGVNRFFTDLAAASGRSDNSDAVSAQYNDSSGAVAAYASSFGGSLIDTDPLPVNGCPASPGGICLTDAQLQAELNGFLSSSGMPADVTHEYFLLTPPDVASCFDSAGSSCSGNAEQNQQFCAYHSQSTADYIYANVPDLTGLDGCDPFATSLDCFETICEYPNGSADGVLSAISHEHNESITDPQPNNAWTDYGSSIGGEIGDKCGNDAFDDPSLQWVPDGFFAEIPYNETIDGDRYLIQMEWSNQGKTCLDSFVPGGTVAHAAFSASVATGRTVSFDAGASSATGGVAQYVWQFNDGPGQTSTVETTQPTIAHTFATPGNYVVALTVMAGDGTSNGTAQSITVTPAPPTAAFTIGASPVAGQPLAFDATGSVNPNPGGSISAYSWAFGDRTTGSGSRATHAYAAAGTFTVTLTVADSDGQTATVSHVVSVEAPQGPPGVPECVVPRLKGMSLKGTRPLLSGAHCALGQVSRARHKPHRRAGRHRRWMLVVVQTAPRTGAVMPRGTRVTLRLGYRAVRNG